MLTEVWDCRPDHPRARQGRAEHSRGRHDPTDMHKTWGEGQLMAPSPKHNTTITTNCNNNAPKHCACNNRAALLLQTTKLLLQPPNRVIARSIMQKRFAIITIIVAIIGLPYYCNQGTNAIVSLLAVIANMGVSLNGPSNFADRGMEMQA